MIQLTDDQKQLTFDITKLATAWAAVGITSWSDFAAFVASMYTLVLLIDFVWRRWLRPLLQRSGWWASHTRSAAALG